MAGLKDVIMSRRSQSRVTDSAPSHEDLLPLVQAAGRSADHGSLQPWRLIEIRGDARLRLGEAFAHSENKLKPSTKPLRSPLLIALVVRHVPSKKVPNWEQDAAAAGVGHTLSLLLHDAGWGVIWRTGPATRSEPVRKLHQLSPDEALLGWLCVGGVPYSKDGSRPAKLINPEEFISVLPKS